MRNIFLIVGLFLVVVIFRDHSTGFYVSAAIVYFIYSSMGKQNRQVSLSGGARPIAKPRQKEPLPDNPVNVDNARDVLSRPSPSKSESEGIGQTLSTEPPPKASADYLPANSTHDRFSESPSTDTVDDEKDSGLVSMGEREQLVKVRSFATPTDAHLTAAMLRSMGIPCLITDNSQFTTGISLFVNQKDLEAVREILNEIDTPAKSQNQVIGSPSEPNSAIVGNSHNFYLGDTQRQS